MCFYLYLVYKILEAMNGNDENRYMTNSVNYTKPDYCKKKFNSPKNFRATDNFYKL